MKNISHFTLESLVAVCPVQCHISQNCELSMVNGQYSCKVARLDSQDGCPVNSGSRWAVIGGDAVT